MIELFDGYNLTQFIMISPEVFQDLHQRYWAENFFWFIAFFLLNIVIIFRKNERLIFSYVAFCWLYIAIIYFKKYLSEVHTFAFVMSVLFVIEAIAIIVCKVIYSKKKIKQITKHQRKTFKAFGLLIFIASATLPISYFSDNSKGVLLLFGWGSVQTAIGTIGITLYLWSKKRDVLLLIIPILWLIPHSTFL